MKVLMSSVSISVIIVAVPVITVTSAHIVARIVSGFANVVVCIFISVSVIVAVVVSSVFGSGAVAVEPALTARLMRRLFAGFILLTWFHVRG